MAEHTTSRQVSDAAQPTFGERRSVKQRIVAFVEKRSDGATSDEMEAHLEIAHQTVAARLGELERAGLLHCTDAMRKTRNGKLARVYFAGPPPAGVPGVVTKGRQSRAQRALKEIKEEVRSAFLSTLEEPDTLFLLSVRDRFSRINQLVTKGLGLGDGELL